MSIHHQRSGSKERFWRRMVRLCRNSGLSVRAFCAQHELAEPTFYAWRRTLAQRDATAPAFLLVQETADISTPASSAVDGPADAHTTFELVLRGGRRLRVGPGFDGATLQRLLALLEEGQA